MREFKTMAIPVEADGIVNDQKQFEEQMAANEAQLEQEIKDSYDDQSYDSLMNDYEDYEYVPNPYSKMENMSDKDKAKMAKKMQDLLAKLKAKEVFNDVS
ncbi:hypothetical protein J5500_04820 [Candidatus Saccharibacteria bacterium]|nr:hypothetical protein [Candidatus Saccharibacteria bacterium]